MNKQLLSDEGHTTLRTIVGCVSLLLAIGLCMKACEMDKASDAAAEVVETCVKHPVTQKVVVQ